MKRVEYFTWIGIAAAAGAALGMLSDRKNPGKGGLVGASAGLVAGAVAAGFYQYATTEKVPFYTNASPFYDDIDAV